MKRQEIVDRLHDLRVEIEQEDGVPISVLETTFALALADVCNTLKLTREERDQVLVEKATAYVAGIDGLRFWPVGMREEMATIASTTSAVSA